MEFNPSNPIVKLCLQGMAAEENGNSESASQRFLQAWNEAEYDFEKIIAAYYVAKYQVTVFEKLKWLETALQLSLKIDDDSVVSALPSLHQNIAACYVHLGEPDEAKQHYGLATSYQKNPTDKGPFYHGTKADLNLDGLLTAGGSSNYKADLTMNHIYFTALINGAGLAAALAK